MNLYQSGAASFDQKLISQLDRLMAKWWGTVRQMTDLLGEIQAAGIKTDTPHSFVSAASALKEEIEDVEEREMRRADAAATRRKVDTEDW